MRRNATLIYDLSEESLTAYCKEALRNCESLVQEAVLLANGGFYSRAYFLAVAAIEEVGKCHLAILGKQRNLKDPAIQSRLKKSFQDHSEKITLATLLLFENDSNGQDEVHALLDLGSPLCQTSCRL